AAEDILIVEDDPYGELRYAGEPQPTLLSLGREHGASVVHLGSFSKVLAPGLRMGYIVAPREIIDKLVQIKQATDLHSSTLSQIGIYESITADSNKHHLLAVRHLYHQKGQYMLDAMAVHFHYEAVWTRP